jgi:uncharacterized protein
MASWSPREPFVPARGITSAHAQTVFAFVRRRGRTPSAARERWDTEDGDFVDVDITHAPHAKGTVLILHGLEGSSKAGYVAATIRWATRFGLRAVALNFRSCSGHTNRQARSYHSGDTADALLVARLIAERFAGPLYAVGFSLGGNVLLKLLAETGDASPISAAATVSVPYDLARCAQALDEGGGWVAVYRTVFLRSLKQKALHKARAHPGAIDADAVNRVRTIAGFDEVVTARLNGFASAADYYARSSSGPLLGAIRVPTLLVSAADDPLVPTAVPHGATDNPWVHPVATAAGGHVGFVAGSVLAPRFWAEEQALAFLTAPH